jgi:hypothetical protein
MAGLDFDAARRRYLALLGIEERPSSIGPQAAKTPCEHCGATEGVELEGSRTLYPFEGQPIYIRDVLKNPDILKRSADPNKPVYLCRACAKAHHEHWDELWADYHAGLV